MRGEFSELATFIQTTLSPVTNKLQTLESKVDALNMDRVTRSDIEKLRSEMSTAYVPRDAYEPRHAALIERDAQIENLVREVRRDIEVQMKQLRDDTKKESQKIHERLESGKQQIEDRFKEQQEIQLSARDRTWVRWSQVVGYIGMALAILGFIVDHINFH